MTARSGVPSPVQEYRFVADLAAHDLPAFREALVNLAGGFTEIDMPRGTPTIVGLRGPGSEQQIQKLLDEWSSRDRRGAISLEDQKTAQDRDEVFFLLPIRRIPKQPGKPRPPLFTNERLAEIREELARQFQFRPDMVRVYGEWRNSDGQLIPDPSLLIRVPRRSEKTAPRLRAFIRRAILANPDCDQDCIYLSSRWRGEFVAGS